MKTPPLVSVVVVGYQRPRLLVQTTSSLLKVSRYPRFELILCDDGSPPSMQEQMRDLPFDQFLMARANEGLGRNNNKGIAAARGEYILHLQDDWLCRGPPDFVEAAIELFEERPDVHLVRFRKMAPPAPFEPHVTRSGRVARVFQNGAFAQTGAYPYSDNPHLKRKSFHERLGLYREGVPMTVMELEFCARVDAQADVRIAELEGYDVFEHLGEAQSFNPSVRRRQLKERLEKNWVTRLPLAIYLAWRHRGKTR